MMQSLLTTQAGKAVSRLGLAGNPDMDSRCVDVAFDGGLSYFFFYDLTFQGLVAGLNRLCKNKRDDVFVTTGTEDRDAPTMDTYLESVKRRVGIDFVDLFFAQYVSPAENWDDVEASLSHLQEWKNSGKVGAVGATVHSRELALKLIACGKIDVLMHRYNMAHRKSESSVLPAAMDAGIPVVSFTNTRWGSLLKGHRKWDEQVPSAVDCYRYVLQNPAIRVALTAPSAATELAENLQVLASSEPADVEMDRWRRYGDLVYGDGQDAFETRWP